jgi:hypothetical protein
MSLGNRLGSICHVRDLSGRGQNLPLQIKWGIGQELQGMSIVFAKYFNRIAQIPMKNNGTILEGSARYY